VKKSADLDFDVIIEPELNVTGYWREIWKFKSLFYYLAWRDVLVRYKQTAVGIAWSLLKPIITLGVFTVVFGFLAKFPNEGAPYPILVLCGLLPWQFFANCFSDASNSIIANSNIISKVYFPRIIIPISSTLGNIIDFLITFSLLMIMLFFYGMTPTLHILTIPLFLGLALLLSLGLGLMISAINVKYRDFKYLIPVILQAGLYLSPVGFSSHIVPEKWHFIYSLNPLVGIIDGFRWAIIGGNINTLYPSLCFSLFWSFFFLLIGISYFRKSEKKFVDFV
jgi:lipopolysaccharide transport system permease protein